MIFWASYASYLSSTTYSLPSRGLPLCLDHSPSIDTSLDHSSNEVHTRAIAGVNLQLAIPSRQQLFRMSQGEPCRFKKNKESHSQNMRPRITPHRIKVHLRLCQRRPGQLRIQNRILMPHRLSKKRAQRSNDTGAVVRLDIVRFPC